MTSLVFHLLYPLTVTGTIVYPGNTFLLSSPVMHFTCLMLSFAGCSTLYNPDQLWPALREARPRSDLRDLVLTNKDEQMEGFLIV